MWPVLGYYLKGTAVSGLGLSPIKLRPLQNAQLGGSVSSSLERGGEDDTGLSLDVLVGLTRLVRFANFKAGYGVDVSMGRLPARPPLRVAVLFQA